MPTFLPPAFARAAACAVAGLIAATARADAPLRVPMLPAYQQECGSCHLAYPPGLLPAASWQRLLGGLERHFGSDASLDAATVRQLSQWLGANAGSYRKVQREGAPPEERITRAAWFAREHREVPADAWKRPSIRSAAQCAACHTRAEQGDFDEHAVRIPR